MSIIGREDNEDEIIEIGAERSRCRRRRPSADGEVIDLTPIRARNDNGRLGRSRPEQTPQVPIIYLPFFPWKSMTLRPGKVVELTCGDFLRVEKIENQLVVNNSTTDIKSEIFLRGILFARATKLRFLQNKENEVVIIEEEARIKLFDIRCSRRLIITNAPIPVYRREGLLVCRWVWGIKDEMKYEGIVRRITEDEADEKYRYDNNLLKEQWRHEKIEELREQEEKRRQAAIRRIAESKARRSEVDLTRDCFLSVEYKSARTVQSAGVTVFSNQSRPLNTIIPSTPRKALPQDTDEGYYTGKRQSKSNHTLPSPQNSLAVIKRNLFPGSSSNRNRPLLILDEEEDDMPLLRLHREDTFTNCLTGDTLRASHLVQLHHVKSASSVPLKPSDSTLASPISLLPETVVKAPTQSQTKTRKSKDTIPKYTFGDAFCGAGGMSRAADMAGFRVTWGVDHDAAAIEAYRMNFRKASCYHASIDQFLTNLEECILIDVLHLSPPCQPYSPAHTRDGKNDESNQAALFSISEFLVASRPRYAIVEQTDGILNKSDFLSGLLLQFSDKGFSLAYKVLHGAEYGVPQTRKRLFVIAAGPGEILPSFPAPTHYLNTPEPNLIPATTIYDIISVIPPDASEQEPRFFSEPKIPTNPHRQCRTIMAGGSDQEYHPSGLRPLTIREKACLQTFPTDHIFRGAYTKKQSQVGNAVPPVLGRAVLLEVKRALERADGERTTVEGGSGRNEIVLAEERHSGRNQIVLTEEEDEDEDVALDVVEIVE